jgi:hypothetical protein
MLARDIGIDAKLPSKLTAWKLLGSSGGRGRV